MSSEVEENTLSSWRSQLISSYFQGCSKVSWWYFIQSSINTGVDLRHLHLGWSWFNCKAGAQHWAFWTGQVHTTALQPSCSETLGSYAQLIRNFWEENVFKYWLPQMCDVQPFSELTEFLFLWNSSCFCQRHEFVLVPESILMPEPFSRKVILHNSVLFSDQICKSYFSWGLCGPKITLTVYFCNGECLIETDFLGVLHQEWCINTWHLARLK